MECIENSGVLKFIGGISMLYVIFKIFSFIIVHFTPSRLDLKSFGKWALVTGSTDGIGKGIARELAKLGINIVLVSRNPEKLKKVAEEIENDFRVEVKCVTFDFTTDDVISDTFSVYDVVRDAIEELEIGILVNNVGIGNEHLDMFLDTFSKGDLAKGTANMINCNMTSMAKMTEYCLPQMVKCGKGLVINISSSVASFILPKLALYAATKKFNDTFSKALSYEYEDGVVIQSIQPFIISTNLTNAKPSLLVPTYTHYTSHLMKTIGKERMCKGYWSHALQALILGTLPEKFIAATRKKKRGKDN